MIVHTDMRDMCGHSFENALAAHFQETLLSGAVELQQRRAELKSLGPFSPAAGAEFTFYCEDRGPFFEIPALFEAEYFAC